MYSNRISAPTSVRLSRTPVVVLLAQDLRWIISAFSQYLKETPPAPRRK